MIGSLIDSQYPPLPRCGDDPRCQHETVPKVLARVLSDPRLGGLRGSCAPALAYEVGRMAITQVDARQYPPEAVAGHVLLLLKALFQLYWKEIVARNRLSNHQETAAERATSLAARAVVGADRVVERGLNGMPVLGGIRRGMRMVDEVFHTKLMGRSAPMAAANRVANRADDKADLARKLACLQGSAHALEARILALCAAHFGAAVADASRPRENADGKARGARDLWLRPASVNGGMKEEDNRDDFFSDVRKTVRDILAGRIGVFFGMEHAVRQLYGSALSDPGMMRAYGRDPTSYRLAIASRNGRANHLVSTRALNDARGALADLRARNMRNRDARAVAPVLNDVSAALAASYYTLKDLLLEPIEGALLRAAARTASSGLSRSGPASRSG